MRGVGLNRTLFEMANIRDQCSWVQYAREPERATAKAKDAVRMAVAKTCCLTALEEMQLPVTPSALTIAAEATDMTEPEMYEAARKGTFKGLYCIGHDPVHTPVHT